jgi:hypothetical protein
MMHNHVVLVLAGGAAHFLTGWALNSDMLFGQLWKKDKDKSKSCGFSKDMRINIAAQLVASLALSVATCVAIAVFEKYQAPAAVSKDAMAKLFSMFFSPENATKSFMNAFHTVMFIWAGFIIPTSVGEVIWCGHNWKNWMLEMGMELAGLLAIAATVIYLG